MIQTYCASWLLASNLDSAVRVQPAIREMYPEHSPANCCPSRIGLSVVPGRPLALPCPWLRQGHRRIIVTGPSAW